MSNKTIGDLREAMFATLADVRSGAITLEQAKVMGDIGQVIINSAKVEVEYIRANNGGESAFIDAVGNDNLPTGITGVRQHRIKG